MNIGSGFCLFCASFDSYVHRNSIQVQGRTIIMGKIFCPENLIALPVEDVITSTASHHPVFDCCGGQNVTQIWTHQVLDFDSKVLNQENICRIECSQGVSFYPLSF